MEPAPTRLERAPAVRYQPVPPLVRPRVCSLLCPSAREPPSCGLRRLASPRSSCEPSGPFSSYAGPSRVSSSSRAPAPASASSSAGGAPHPPRRRPAAAAPAAAAAAAAAVPAPRSSSEPGRA
eukprot:scaffold129788_cov57-Phaeocystis_antarctica.AAC.1